MSARTQAVVGRLLCWACLTAAWLAALAGVAYLVDEIAGQRTAAREWCGLVGAAVILGYWPAVLYLLATAREDEAAAARRRVLDEEDPE